MDSAEIKDMEEFKKPTSDNLYSGAVKHVDAVLKMNDEVPQAQIDAAESAGVKVIDGKVFIDSPAELDSFYESLFE